ncbi:MAG: type IX secretion system protein PorQ [Cyclobacteriaceae bacterium]
MKYTFLLFILFLSNILEAQVNGGNATFQFITQSANPRILSAGGQNVSLTNEDINLVQANPSLLTETMAKTASISFMPYFVDTWKTEINYAFLSNKIGLWNIGFHYFSYGTFDQFDNAGTAAGSFNASDVAFTLSTSQKQNNIRLGGTTKLAISSIGGYSATAWLFDLGGVFIHPKKELQVGLTMKNLGLVLGDYSETATSSVPFDIQLGTTFKPQNMPVRFSFTARKLTDFDIAYFDPARNIQLDDRGNEVVANSPGFGDKLFRHFIIGTDLVLNENVELRAAFNPLQRKELKLQNAGSAAGFSLGAMVKAKGFEFAATRAFYHKAGGIFSFSVSKNFSKDIKTKTQKNQKVLKVKKTREEREADRKKALEEYRQRNRK